MRACIRVAVIVSTIAVGRSATLHAQTPDAAARADIEKLLEVTGAGKVGAQIANALTAQMIDAMRKSRPNVPERVADIIKDVLSKEFSSAFDAPDGLHATIVSIYAKHFTPEEVKGLLAFYSTDLGRRAITEMPALAQEGAAAGQAWAAANMPRINDLLQSGLRAEGFLP